MYQHKNPCLKRFRRLSNTLTKYSKRETFEFMSEGGVRGFTDRQSRAYMLKTAITKGK